MFVYEPIASLWSNFDHRYSGVRYLPLALLIASYSLGDNFINTSCLVQSLHSYCDVHTKLINTAGVTVRGWSGWGKTLCQSNFIANFQPKYSSSYMYLHSSTHTLQYITTWVRSVCFFFFFLPCLLVAS